MKGDIRDLSREARLITLLSDKLSTALCRDIMPSLTETHVQVFNRGSNLVDGEDRIPGCSCVKEHNMANKTLKLKLTSEQKRQIREATGKDLSEINVDLTSTGQLSEKDLEQVAAGATKKKSY